MVFPIAGGYEISNSLRFNDNDSPALTITPSGAGDRDVFTMSFWVKRANIGSAQRIFTAGTSIGTNNDNLSSLLFESNDTLKFFGEVSGSVSFTLQTNRVFRDPSAWYHIVVAVNTEDGTSSNRIKLYVNGVQESSFSSSSYMSQNTDTFFNATNKHVISYEGSGYLDCYLTEFHYIDGQQLAQTQFGEFDDNGVWIPIKYTGTYGTNGFYLEFQQTGTSANSSGIGADTSGNDNHFTPTNLAATDITEDTCTNNFATFNSVFAHDNQYFSGPATLREGNTGATGVNTEGNVSTIGLTQGKWYWEVKIVTRVSNDLNINIINIGDNTGTLAASIAWQSQDDLYVNGSKTADLNSFTDDDIIGVALDLDSSTPNVKFYKNGTVENSGNAIDFAASDRDNGVIFASIGIENTSDDVLINFGNPAFAISSGNNDGKYGNFEYAPPSGYYALCTKRLAEFG